MRKKSLRALRIGAAMRVRRLFVESLERRILLSATDWVGQSSPEMIGKHVETTIDLAVPVLWSSSASKETASATERAGYFEEIIGNPDVFPPYESYMPMPFPIVSAEQTSSSSESVRIDSFDLITGEETNSDKPNDDRGIPCRVIV